MSIDRLDTILSTGISIDNKFLFIYTNNTKNRP